MFNINSLLSSIFNFHIWGSVSSAYPIPLWWSWECLLYLNTIIKSEAWIINHCLWLSHETMVCTVCVAMRPWNVVCWQLQKFSSRNQMWWLPADDVNRRRCRDQSQFNSPKPSVRKSITCFVEYDIMTTLAITRAELNRLMYKHHPHCPRGYLYAKRQL